MKYLILGSLFFLCSTVVVAQVEDSLTISTEQDSLLQFQRIEGAKLPDYKVVRETLMRSNLFDICESMRFDALERDLLFMNSANYSFEEYKHKKILDDSGREYIDVFPEENLKFFWKSARVILLENSKKDLKNK